MTEERKEELKQLLNSAKGEIVIKPSHPKSRDVSVDEYSECIKACRKSYRPDLTGIVRHYRPAIKNDNLSSKLFHFIKKELAEHLHE